MYNKKKAIVTAIGDIINKSNYDGTEYYEVQLIFEDNPDFLEIMKYIKDRNNNFDWRELSQQFKISGTYPSSQMQSLNKNVIAQPQLLDAMVDSHKNPQGQSQQGQGSQPSQGDINYRLSQKDGSFTFTPTSS